MVMNKKYTIGMSISIVAICGVLYSMQNCAGQGFGVNEPGNEDNGQMASSSATTQYVQIERLGRPAVNEGLVLSNKNLNAFNSIPPTLDLATGNPAVLAVLQEAAASLGLVDSLEGKLNFKKGFESEVVAGFLPDVMRIDTAKSIPVGTAGYNGDFVLVDGTQAAMLTGGRKIEDDVVDITLSYLVAGDPTGATIKDNVSFAGVSGNPSQGHQKLTGQSNYNGPAQFPFLAPPIQAN